jgi:hypothetical protein
MWSNFLKILTQSTQVYNFGAKGIQRDPVLNNDELTSEQRESMLVENLTTADPYFTRLFNMGSAVRRGDFGYAEGQRYANIEFMTAEYNQLQMNFEKTFSNDQYRGRFIDALVKLSQLEIDQRGDNLEEFLLEENHYLNSLLSRLEDPKQISDLLMNQLLLFRTSMSNSALELAKTSTENAKILAPVIQRQGFIGQHVARLIAYSHIIATQGPIQFTVAMDGDQERLSPALLEGARQKLFGKVLSLEDVDRLA